MFPCQAWAEPPAKEGVSKSWFVACGALAPAHKKRQGEEIFPLRKQAYVPGSLEPFPGRIQHPTLLVFTVQTSCLPQGSPRRKRGPHPCPGLPNSSEVRASPGTTFYFCPRAGFSCITYLSKHRLESRSAHRGGMRTPDLLFLTKNGSL